MDAVAPDISRSVGACVSQFTRNQILFFLYQTDFVSRLLRSGTPERNRPLGYLRQTLSLAMQDLPHGLPLAQLRVCVSATLLLSRSP